MNGILVAAVAAGCILMFGGCVLLMLAAIGLKVRKG